MDDKRHIDDVQTSTVAEHMKLIMEDRSTIDPEYVPVTPDDLPHWMDKRLFKIGQKYYMKNMLGVAVANMTGLLAILCVPDIIEVLEYTKKSETVCLSFKRYAETVLLIYELFKSDMLHPKSKWFKALNVIRWKHASASKRRVKQSLNAIYQKDMSITQFGFMGFVLVCPEKTGLALTTLEEREGFNHFWRVTAHLLGISDRMNIARRTAAETTELCRRIGDEILVKYMDKPSPGFIKLGRNAIDGLWYNDMSLDTDAFFALTYDLAGSKYQKPLGWYSYCNMKQREWLLYFCNIPYIGAVVRVGFNYTLMFLYWVLENYPVVAWIGFGKKNAQFCAYPTIK
ncbi:PREDICTED: uncharacterized protein LOC107194421 [Dufourea novaeangliae]|uniref:Uncharacterized protein n=1 Tax=Dufourea novaeangliae TaxID=178035 RepID=A0A154NWH4_DUFNO|nr:PREDICTED: uncharacterized protein LOC107194421 [Dufourea novaeangliae]KZC03997.1 hypothetical protein WN55_01258 [Dufourea novaeangliae]